MEHGAVVEEELGSCMIARCQLLDSFELESDLTNAEPLTSSTRQFDLSVDGTACFEEVAREHDIDLDLGMLGNHVHVILCTITVLYWILETANFEIIARRDANYR